MLSVKVLLVGCSRNWSWVRASCRETAVVEEIAVRSVRGVCLVTSKPPRGRTTTLKSPLGSCGRGARRKWRGGAGGGDGLEGVGVPSCDSPMVRRPSLPLISNWPIKLAGRWRQLSAVAGRYLFQGRRTVSHSPFPSSVASISVPSTRYSMARRAVTTRRRGLA